MRFEESLYTIPLRLRSIFRRKRVEDDLDDEMRFHLEQLVEQNLTRGMAPNEARYAALRSMDGLTQRQEECRDARRMNVVETILQDIRYAVRTMRKSPAFASIAVLSIALAIGANTAIFGLIDTLLLRPLPVPDPSALRQVVMEGKRAQASFTYSLFDQVRRRNHTFSKTFAWANHEFQTSIGGDAVHVHGVLASGEYFTTLGVPAAIGRTYTNADDHASGGDSGPVAVISDRLWSRQFHRDPSAIGRSLVLDGVRFTVIGAMPSRFFGAEVGQAPDIWVPLELGRTTGEGRCIDSRSCWWLIVMGRLKPGIPPQQVTADLHVISRSIMQDTLPPNYDREADRQDYLHRVLGAQSGERGWSFLRERFTNPLAVLMTLVGVVLLVACANLANLLLARASARHKEIAVRLAMGAGRARVIRQLLTESVLISIAGALIGSVFAAWASRVLVAFLSSDRNEFILDLSPDWRVLLFASAAAVVTGILFGLAPAFRATRVGISAALKERAHNVRGGEGRLGVGRVLLTLQVGFSILLVAGAGLFAGSLHKLLTLDPGFRSANLAVIGIDTAKRTEKGPALADIYTRLLDRLNGMPDVEAASVVTLAPLTNNTWDQDISIPGRTDLSEPQRDSHLNAIGPRFFDTMQQPLLSGRAFSPGDTASAEKVAILSENAAALWFPNRSALGQHVVLEKTLLRVVGITANAKYESLRDDKPLTMYLPYTQNMGDNSMEFVVRTRAELKTLYPAFHQILREIAPGTPVSAVRTMDELVDESLGRERLLASLSIFFGVLALLLTSIGLYGILAYAVTRRTGEIGIRMALGAQRRSVVWLVLRETVNHAVLGVALGIIAVLFVARTIETLLYGIRPADPGILALAALTLAAVALLAAYLPARRASRLDPVIALREE